MQRAVPLFILCVVAVGIVVFISLVIGEYAEIARSNALANLAEAEARRESAAADRASAEADATRADADATRADAELQRAYGERNVLDASAGAVRTQSFLMGLIGVFLTVVSYSLIGAVIGCVIGAIIVAFLYVAEARRHNAEQLDLRDAARRRANGKILVARSGTILRD